MIVKDLKRLVAVKRNKPVRSLKPSSNIPNSSKAPRSILAEVLFSSGKWYALIDNDRYPLEVTEEDYKNANYIFSSPHNDKWDWYTMKTYTCEPEKINHIKDFWWIIDPTQKTHVYIQDGTAKLDMVKNNNRNYRRYSKLKPSYHADRSRKRLLSCDARVDRVFKE